jgi:hypothetical protein
MPVVDELAAWLDDGPSALKEGVERRLTQPPLNLVEHRVDV